MSDADRNNANRDQPNQPDQPDQPEPRNVVIIGSGPAGWTAALYTARAQLKPMVFEGAAPNVPGGQLMWTSDVENYPGFPEAVTGPELMERMKAQAERFGCDVFTENVTRVDLAQRPFTLWTEEGKVIQARTIIISTGANAKLLGIPTRRSSWPRAPACRRAPPVTARSTRASRSRWWAAATRPWRRRCS